MRRPPRRRRSSPRIAPPCLPRRCANGGRDRCPSPPSARSTSAPPTRPSPCPDGAAMRLLELEPGGRTMPTAVFYLAEGAALHTCVPPSVFGRAAIAAYVDGFDGRLMRSMKSILGSPLVDQTHRHRRRPRRQVHRRHRELPAAPEARRRRRRRGADRARRARPPGLLRRRRPGARRRGAGLARAPRARVGFREVRFQYEPIAAAFDYEERVDARGAGARGRHRRRHVGLLGRARRARARGTARPQRRHPGQPRRARRRHRLRPPRRARAHPAGLGYGAYGPERRRRAGARGAEPRLLRPRHLAPDQHRLPPAARGGDARHARRTTPTRATTRA